MRVRWWTAHLQQARPGCTLLPPPKKLDPGGPCSKCGERHRCVDNHGPRAFAIGGDRDESSRSPDIPLLRIFAAPAQRHLEALRGAAQPGEVLSSRLIAFAESPEMRVRRHPHRHVAAVCIVGTSSVQRRAAGAARGGGALDVHRLGAQREERLRGQAVGMHAREAAGELHQDAPLHCAALLKGCLWGAGKIGCRGEGCGCGA